MYEYIMIMGASDDCICMRLQLTRVWFVEDFKVDPVIMASKLGRRRCNDIIYRCVVQHD